MINMACNKHKILQVDLQFLTQIHQQKNQNISSTLLRNFQRAQQRGMKNVIRINHRAYNSI